MQVLLPLAALLTRPGLSQDLTEAKWNEFWEGWGSDTHLFYNPFKRQTKRKEIRGEPDSDVTEKHEINCGTPLSQALR